MGHGVQKICLELFKQWGGGTIILSPMNIEPKQIEKFSADVRKVNGNILLDSQLYYPRKFQKNLSKYEYWPHDNITLLESGNFDTIIAHLVQLNQSVGSSILLLPSLSANHIDARWNGLQKSIITSASKVKHGFDVYHTIALGEKAMLDEEQIEEIVNYIEEWDVSGIYIVCEHPSNKYLVDDAIWVSNQLSLVAGIKRTGKKVIVGYSNHQQLCLAAAKCDAIASGNFRNVRWFQPEHFETIDSDEQSRRAKWYYCPQALTEIKITFLDIARRISLLSALKTEGKMENSYSDMLFSGALPSSTGYSERDSFMHYLWCLKEQCRSSARSTYKETYDAQMAMLETAEQILTALHEKRIRGQDRDFLDIISINEAALSVHNMTYQFSLSREWDTL